MQVSSGQARKETSNSCYKIKRGSTRPKKEGKKKKNQILMGSMSRMPKGKIILKNSIEEASAIQIAISISRGKDRPSLPKTKLDLLLKPKGAPKNISARRCKRILRYIHRQILTKSILLIQRYLIPAG